MEHTDGYPSMPMELHLPPDFIASDLLPMRCIMTGSQEDLILYRYSLKPPRPTFSSGTMTKTVEVDLPISRTAMRRMKWERFCCAVLCVFGFGMFLYGAGWFAVGGALQLGWPAGWLLVLIATLLFLGALSISIGHPTVTTDGRRISVYFPARAKETYNEFVCGFAAWQKRGGGVGDGVAKPEADPDEAWADRNSGHWDEIR